MTFPGFLGFYLDRPFGAILFNLFLFEVLRRAPREVRTLRSDGNHCQRTNDPQVNRRADIPALAKHFALKFGEQCGRPIVGIAPDAEAYLCHYEWPGNIRELENAIERAVVLGSGDVIQLEDLPESIREIGKAAGLSRTIPLQDAIDDAKKQAIARAFEQARGEHPVAARLLGVHPNYLYRLMRNLGMR